MPDPVKERAAEVDSWQTTAPTGEAATQTDLPAIDLGTAGRFRLLGEIARGGMGVVYSAHDPQFGREVAVKTLIERFAGRPDTARRFLEEAVITGQLQHPGIPAVFESGTLDDGRPYLAMKLVKGRTLTDLIEGGSSNRTDLIPAFEKICQALAYAHSRRVLHRDLKPSNVMVGAFGEVQVMDWGLAKVLGERQKAGPTDPDATTAGGTKIDDPRTDSGSSETQAGTMLGTPAYMPPEQAAGSLDLIDERADVFGLGAILCVLLTGEPPYAGKDGEAVRRMALRAMLEGCHARLDACGADPELVALARRCLSPEVADRPRNAGEVAAAVAELRRRADERARQAELERARAELRVEEERKRTELRAEEERKRRRVKLALAASVFGFLLFAGGGAWWAHQQAVERGLREDAHEQRERLMEQVREEREKRVRDGVERVFARLPELYDRALWAQAEASLDQATYILGDDGDAELRGRVEAARRDTAFVRRLDEIRMGKIELTDGGRAGLRVFDFAGALEKYATAFEDWGFAVDTADRVGLLDRLNESPICAYLLAALDDWALTETNPARRKTLFDLTAEATRQRWRARLTEVWDDGAKLASFYDAIPPRERSAGLIVGVGARLDALGQDGVRTLEEGLRHYPGDFWLHVQLGMSGPKDQPERIIGAYRAALAVRPGAAGIHNNLGAALRDKGDHAGAAASYREAIRLDRKDAAPHLGLGNALRAKGDHAGAMASYREAIRLDPKHAKAHNNLGNVLSDKGDHAGAAASYREAIRLDPKLAAPHLGLGNVQYAKGDLAGAMASFREAIRLDPKDAKAHHNLGLALRAKGDLAGAMASFREAIRLDPKHAKTHYNLGLALRDKGDHAGAAASYREAIRHDPKHAKAHRGLGNAQYAKGDHAGAAASFREAIRLDPKDAKAHHNLGLALRDKGDHAGAAASYREAIRLDPKLAALHLGLGNAQYAKGDHAGAMASFREAIRLDPKDAEPHNNLGVALDAKGDHAGAAASYREAIRLDPKLAAPHHGLGVALDAKGDRAGAAASFREAIRLDPKDAKAHNNLGNVLSDKGDQAGAAASYREAIRLDPKLAAPHHGLGNVQYAKGDYAGAAASYREAIRLDPKDAKAHRSLGNVQYVKGDLAGATASYREAIRLDPKDAEPHNNLGVALDAKGDLAGAAASYREAIRLDPKNAPAHANLGLLAMQQGRLLEAAKSLDVAVALAPTDMQKQANRTQVRRMLALSERFPAIEAGTDAPRSAAEAVEFAEFATLEFQKRYALAYRFYLSAFDDRKLIAPNRYNAACVALRFADGDDPKEKAPGKQRTSVRKQAREWLAADLALLRGLATSEMPADRKRAAGTLHHWLADADLASVRDPKRLEKLPPEERQRWEAFWADVRATLSKVTAPPPSTK